MNVFLRSYIRLFLFVLFYLKLLFENCFYKNIKFNGLLTSGLVGTMQIEAKVTMRYDFIQETASKARDRHRIRQKESLSLFA
jgi:hypothetical protein